MAAPRCSIYGFTPQPVSNFLNPSRELIPILHDLDHFFLHDLFSFVVETGRVFQRLCCWLATAQLHARAGRIVNKAPFSSILGDTTPAARSGFPGPLPLHVVLLVTFHEIADLYLALCLTLFLPFFLPTFALSDQPPEVCRILYEIRTLDFEPFNVPRISPISLHQPHYLPQLISFH